jgi:hypothetical protein
LIQGIIYFKKTLAFSDGIVSVDLQHLRDTYPGYVSHRIFITTVRLTTY